MLMVVQVEQFLYFLRFVMLKWYIIYTVLIYKEYKTKSFLEYAGVKECFSTP